jgi:hypothetical protein
MASRGYIYHWRTNDGLGRIRVCSGSFADLNVPFAGEDCEATLKKKLDGQNISRERVCPPPNDVLLVKFDLTVQDGDLTATNISLV